MDIGRILPARAARLLFQLPSDSRVFRALHPGNNWGWSEFLLNKATYLLEVLAWQQTKDAQKSNPQEKPTLFMPDFLQKPEEKRAISRDSETHTAADIRDILSRPRQTPTEEKPEAV